MTGDDRIWSEAAAWHVASESDTMDWDGFTLWLEADPRHRAAYDEIALGDALLERHLDSVFGAETNLNAANDPGTADDRPVRRRGWMIWGGLALSACMALAVAIPLTATSDAVHVTTTEARTISLPDGSTVDLAPHSTMTLEDGEMQEIALQGGAMFNIRHNPSRSMSIAVDGLTISDIGTRFDVQSGEGQVRVAVAEGEVHVSATSFPQPVQLPAGQSLRWDRTAGHVSVQPVGTADVGSWREGRLTYQSAPLALVAADLSRYAGVRIMLDPAVRDRPFSGTLAVEHGGTAAQDLAQLMGLELSHDADGYRIGGAR